MEIPLNALHNYISAPVLLAFGIDNLRRYRKNQNSTSLQLALFCILTSFAQFCFGIPALFTQDSRLLSLGTLGGDLFLAFGLLSLWLIINRAFLSGKPVVKNIVTATNWLVAVGLCVESLVKNLQAPYGTSLTRDAAGVASLVYRDEFVYNALIGIHSLALIFIAIFFWRQGKMAATSVQRMRIRSVSIGMILGSSPYFLNPFLPLGKQAVFSVIMWSAAAIALATLNVVALFLQPRTDSAR